MGSNTFKSWLQHNFGMNEEDCALFEPDLQTQNIAKKELYLEEGMVCSKMAFVEKGAFRLYYNNDGKEINNHFFLENEFVVSFQSFIEQKPSHYNIEALEEAALVYLDHKVVMRAYNQSHKWERFGRIMAERSFQLTIERVEDFQFLDAEARYLKLMHKHPEWLKRIPLYHLASYLGVERESLSRLRKSAISKM